MYLDVRGERNDPGEVDMSVRPGALLSVSAMLLALAACGSQAAPAPATPTAAAPTSTTPEAPAPTASRAVAASRPAATPRAVATKASGRAARDAKCPSA